MIRRNPPPVTPIRRFLASLEDAKCCPRKRGDGWQSRCPAHDDSSPSLSIGVGDDGRVLVCCHAGCSGEDVLAALRMKWSDIMPAEAVGPLWGRSPKGVQRGDR